MNKIRKIDSGGKDRQVRVRKRHRKRKGGSVLLVKRDSCQKGEDIYIKVSSGS